IQYVDILKITIPRMNNLGIPLTPENYAVWYEYSRGTIIKLNKIIDDYLNEGKTFTREINDQLYREYIGETSSEAIEEIQAATKVIIEDLMQRMQQMTSGNSRFSSTLDECKGILQGKPDIKQLTSIIDKVIEETEVVTATNREILDNLAAMEKEVSTLQSNIQELTEASLTDQLTQIPNRRAFEKKLDSLFNDYHTKESVFSLLLVDIDHFKKFNDTHGHIVGDKVLSYVAKCLQKSTGDQGMAARMGGEEFSLLLPESDTEKAVLFADKVREYISSRKLTSDLTNKDIGSITVSIGVSTCKQDDELEGLIERADKALYLAKDSGRNKVCSEEQLANR
ncbi:MAG: GGDEF domain-containing protein, partial [Kangiellaceae bacterium]|nr:GGDEF domain-containing protein [Kangiellaceae bacterium]